MAHAYVDVCNVAAVRHYSFELGVIDPGACRLGDRLAASVEAWIDGAINAGTVA